MSRAVVVQLRQPVAAPLPVVWQVAVDWPRQKDWMLGTTVEVTSGDGASVGSTLSAYSGRRPLGFADTMTITEWDPPRRCVVAHTGRVVRGTGTFSVEPSASGASGGEPSASGASGGEPSASGASGGEPSASTFHWREDLTLPLGSLGAAAWPLVRPAFLAGVRYSLRRFATVCEARAGE